MRTTGKIGVREAKARFSRLVHDAQRGHEWIITQRGTPVAKIVPMRDATSTPLAERLLRLVRLGIIEPATARSRAVPAPLPLEPGIAQRFLQEDRGR